MAEPAAEREAWGSRLGLILAAAGNAVGIGNYLRFPAKAAVSGGGAFMVPYLCALLFLGVPMMWVAWTIGRKGGAVGHGTTPGMFERLWKHPLAKYLGVFGVSLPFIFSMYYVVAESWQLGYAWHSLTGHFRDIPDMESYLREFQGEAVIHGYFSGPGAMLAFFGVTMAFNVWILYRGVAKGIELLAKIAMPLLFVFSLVLIVRMLSMGNPFGKGTALDGLAFVWNPDFSRITDVGIWIVAAGQIFYTLSIGMGALETYASYLKENDDVVLTGLTTASTNEFVEVIFGSCISIPATAMFFGPAQVVPIASKGTFNLGMVAMPEILRNFGGLAFFGTLWFLLLFFAAFTSSVATAQPVMAFFQDELRWSRLKSTACLAVIWTAGALLCIIYFKFGFFDEIDWWAGTIGLVLFSAIEVVLLAWVFGMDRAWDEMHRGAEIRVPRVFYYVIKYVTPLYLIALLAGWLWQGSSDYLGLRPSYTATIVARADRDRFVIEEKSFPEFSQAWREGGDEVTGRFRVAIGPDGNVVSAEPVEVNRADMTFGEAVAAKLRGWRFKPVGADASFQGATFDVMVWARWRKPYVLGAWALMAFIHLLFCGLTAYAWRKRAAEAAA